LGSVELFNVSPISAIETLFGKYLSYLVFGGSLAIVLLTLLVAGMRVPVLGRWTDVGLTILILIYTSLGIGFIISLISSTDTQAVQYAMIMLLTSVFFSGFILELHTLWQPVRLISWMLPATYGILLLRDVMLRGNPIDTTLLLQFATMGTLLFIIAWFLLRRSMVNI
jgi:ABC-2 type transport system permease protein